VRLIRLLAVGVAVVGLAIVARPFLHGLSFVVRAVEMQGTVRRVADFDATAIREREVPIQMPGGSLRARIYEPDGRSTRTVLLVGGLHASGIDEAGLVHIARLLASRRLTVVTPDIPELSRFDVSPALTAAIEQAALSVASDPGLAPDHRIALFGLSFSGGFSIVAAGRPALADRISHVFALGAHDDLPRVMKYLCTGQEPFPPGQARIAINAAGAGSAASTGPFTRAPDAYGLAVMLLAAADRVVPAAQAEPLRDAVREYLRSSETEAAADKPRGSGDIDEALKVRISRLAEPSKTLMRYVLDRDVVHLGARLLPFVNGLTSAPALSVSKSPKPAVPVFLLHGVDDNIIPSVESEYLAEDLRGRAPVRVLVSGAVAQFEAATPIKFGDTMQLASFWGDLLSR
jgi:pimeloyl-ACP methyl ester carboxylesterase